MRKKITKNIQWLFFDRVFRLGLSLLINIWLVRYLGPSQFGQLNYALAYVGLFGALVSFGLSEIVVRDLVRDADSRHATLASAFFLQFLGAIIGIFFLIMFLHWFDGGVSAQTGTMILLFGFALLFKPADVVRYWFEANVNSRVVVWVENGVFLFFAAVKALLIFYKAELLLIAWTLFFETCFTSIFLLLAYSWSGGSLRKWRPRVKKSFELLRDSWPLALSTVAILIYMKVDQVMIGNTLGDEAVGIFSSAVKLCEVWYFMPMIIASSVFPAILSLRNSDEALYLKRMQSLYDLMAYLSLAVAIITTIFADQIIYLLYGSAFKDASIVLATMIWSGVFVSLGVARSKWLVAEGLQHIGYFYTVAALMVNVVGNYFFIDIFGVVGAAYASILAQMTAVIIVPAIYIKTRPSAWMILSSFNPIRFPKIYIEIMSYIKKVQNS
jgi:O-antigen/teichoic acid export membrane protein